MNDGVLLFSIATGGYERLFEHCILSHRAYCRRCDYEYVVIDRSPRRLRPAEAAWLKIPLMQSALAAGYHWVGFVDADCEIRSHAPCFSRHPDLSDGSKSLFLAPGRSGRLNSGLMLVRNSRASADFFQAVLKHAEHDVPEEDRAPYENGHVIFLGKNNPHVGLLRHDLWNNNSTLDERSYIQHYSRRILRKWYVDNLAPTEFRSHPEARVRIAKRWLKKLRATAIQTLRAIRRSTAGYQSISSALSDLVPYYEARFQAFRQSRPAGSASPAAEASALPASERREP
jgi:hypothetical protein